MASSDELSIEELRDLIKSACTELDDVTAGEIASKLHGRGLTKQRRLCKARESDLTESGLNAFQALETCWNFSYLNQVKITYLFVTLGKQLCTTILLSSCLC